MIILFLGKLNVMFDVKNMKTFINVVFNSFYDVFTIYSKRKNISQIKTFSPKK